ncbi:PaaI family thioesterase [Natronolimnohabitans innermongolicus]|uniref:Thioesterase superfamily protein n=1 Tax=Natronolimnohabitans innermongolicus JCM 12255 TaxID=1227499 RepID=L9XKY1_9EURY|nr:PaaI family thioesterase [Natronolimnohabitans innermongolicus]ELY62036.1 thioesterase superfamily protein [Natronolimnohabitans innermongolicus JCM 12255]
MTTESIEQQSSFIETFVTRSEYLSWLDVCIEEEGRESVTASLPASEHVFNPAQGTTPAINGGVISSLVDVAGGFAIWTACTDEQIQLTTTDMNVSFLQPARTDLTATAEVVKIGDTIGVAEIVVESASKADPVATGRTTYYIDSDSEQD